jgi:hypothetical protein
MSQKNIPYHIKYLHISVSYRINLQAYSITFQSSLCQKIIKRKNKWICKFNILVSCPDLYCSQNHHSYTNTSICSFEPRGYIALQNCYQTIKYNTCHGVCLLSHTVETGIQVASSCFTSLQPQIHKIQPKPISHSTKSIQSQSLSVYYRFFTLVKMYIESPTYKFSSTNIFVCWL